MGNRPVTLLCCAVTCVSTALAQAPTPRLHLAPDLRMEARTFGAALGGGQPRIHVGPAGRIILVPGYGGNVVAFDSTGKSLGWTLATGRGDDVEIGWVESAGFVGANLWVNDVRYGQVAIVDPNGKVTKSLGRPSWVRPSWADRRKFPFYADMVPVAVYPDGGMLVLPERPRAFLDTPGFDRKLTHLLRIGPDGVILREVARFDAAASRLTLRGEGRNERSIPIPFAGPTRVTASPDGGRVVVVTPAVSITDSGSYTVTALSDRGDTVFTRRISMPAVRISRASIDSAVRNPGAFGTYTVNDVRAMIVKRIPPFRSMITDVRVGLDHSVWIVTRPAADTDKARDALVLDGNGRSLGSVRMPDNLKEVQVDARHLWGIEKASNAVVRFRLQSTAPPAAAPAIPARPARNGKAGAASSPSKPRA